MGITLKEALNRTQAEYVTVSYDKVEELLGTEKAMDLCESKTGCTQKRGRRAPTGSNLAEYNRKALLEEINGASSEKKVKEKKKDEKEKSPNTPSPSGRDRPGNQVQN